MLTKSSLPTGFLLVLLTASCGPKPLNAAKVDSAASSLGCNFQGSKVGAAVEAATSKVLALTGDVVPGAGLLTQALGYTVTTLIGNDPSHCDSVTMKMQAMESYTREQISALNSRLEEGFAEQTVRNLAIQQADFRSKVDELGTSLTYLRQAKTAHDYDLLLEAPLGAFKEVENWYAALRDSVNTSTDARYITGVYGMLAFQGPYLSYLADLHEAMLNSKKGWKVPHGAQMAAGIASFRAAFAQFVAAITVRRKDAAMTGSIGLTQGDGSYVRFLDAAGNDLWANPPPPVINGFGTFVPNANDYLKKRAQADSIEVTFPDDDYADFTVKAYGAEQVRRSVSLKGVKAIVHPNPLKDCDQDGRPACGDNDLVRKAGIDAIPQYANAKEVVREILEGIDNESLYPLIRVAKIGFF